jgi:hypothetical protein
MKLMLRSSTYNMCNFLTQIIMSSFLSHFPMFYAFFSTKTRISTKTSKNNIEFDFLP